MSLLNRLFKKIRLHYFLILIVFIPILSCALDGTTLLNPNPDGVYVDDEGRLVITRHGISWIFSTNYEYGQFVNGDYWVIGPVQIVQIIPESIKRFTRTMNGSMIDPSPISILQGYDSTMFVSKYDPNLNVALNISSSDPLILKPETSLVSTISVEKAGSRPQLKNSSVLTILSSVPPDHSFRPPYCGTDKTVRYNESQLRYDLLASLAPVADTPSLSTVERYFERLWLDHFSGWNGEYLRPSENMQSYGADVSVAVSIAALMLHLNFTDEQKRTLLIRFIQLGIDSFANVKTAESGWPGGGADGYGRKFPILFAGLILNDTEMMNIGTNPPHTLSRFGEDEQTFYVTQDDVDRTNSAMWNPDVRWGAPEPYTTSDIGLAEWGIYHGYNPYTDNKAWTAAYRTIITGGAWTGEVLALRIMGVQSLWNHPAFFDYMDRYMAVTATSDLNPDWRTSISGMNVIWATYPGGRPAGFLGNMWDTYRDNY